MSALAPRRRLPASATAPSGLAPRVRRAFLPESRRLGVATVVALGVGAAVVIGLPSLNWVTGSPQTRWLGFAILFVIGSSGISLVDALLAFVVFRGSSRPELIALVRLSRTGSSLRWTYGLGSTAASSVSLLLQAAVVLVLLVMRPSAVPTWLLVSLCALSLTSAWISTVVRYACEYAALDAHGDAFEIPGASRTDRLFEEYLHLAVLVQTSAAPSDAVPLTRFARRSMRHHALLSYLLNSVLIALGTSAILSVISATAA